MHTKKNRNRGVLALLLASSSVAHAADGSNTLHWEGNFYGWFPDLTGSVALNSDSSGVQATVPVEQLLDSLQFTFQGGLFVRQDRWGAGLDVVMMNLGNSGQRTRDVRFDGSPLPGAVTAAADFDLDTRIVTLLATYRFSDESSGSADWVFGARGISVDAQLGWQLSSDFVGIHELAAGTASNDKSFWDAVVGVRGSRRMGEQLQWSLPYAFDVGAGDSDLTWQAMLGLGYKLGPGDLVLAWRHLDYNVSGNMTKGLAFDGPLLGYAGTW